MTSMPFLKPIYRIVSAIAMAAVAVVGQPAASSLAVAQYAADRLQGIAGELGDFISPGDCLSATWSPTDSRLFTVPPLGAAPISVGLSSPVALNASSLQYQVYIPGGGYTDWISITNFLQVDSKTFVMTATVTPVAPVNTSFQAIQFRASPVVGSTFVCSPVHTIFAVNTRVRMPVLIQNFAATNIAPVGYTNDPNRPYYNDTICRAVSIWPGATYSARFAERENIFQVTTLTTSTLTVTVSGFTTNGQIQLRRALAACNNTGDFYRYTTVNTSTVVDPTVFQSTPSQTRVMVINNVTPGKSYLRVVSSDDIASNTSFQMNIVFGPPKNDSPFEPNNTSCTAAAIAPNVTYQAYPDDASDWYSFTLSAPINAQLSITNFMVSGAGQYILYKSDNCATLGNPITVQDKATTSYGPVPLQAGKYFLRVAVVSGFQNTQLYNLRVSLSALSVWTPKFDICAALTGCSSNISGNQFSVYWTGTPNMNSLRMRLANRGAIGSCPSGPTLDPITAGGEEYGITGDWTILNVPNGSYNVSISTTSSLGEGFASPVFLVNINCNPNDTSNWSPKFDICPQLTGCSSNLSGNKFTMYWTGTPNMNLLRLRLGNRGASGSCPSGPTAEAITAESAEWGASGDWTLLNIPNGSYDVSIFTTNSLGQQHASQVFRVNMNCSPSALADASVQTTGENVGKTSDANGPNLNPYDALTGAPMPTVIPEGPEPTAIP